MFMILWMDGQTDGTQTVRWTDQIDTFVCRLVDGWTDEWMGGFFTNQLGYSSWKDNARINGWIDGWTEDMYIIASTAQECNEKANSEFYSYID